MTTHTARVREMSGPVDRTAARVMQPGVHYEKVLPANSRHWRSVGDAPKVIPWRSGNRQFAPSGEDLTGRRYGHFTVIGYLGAIDGKSGGKRTGMWLVRCVCGDFEQRTAKAINNPANIEDRCHVCRDVEFKRSGKSDPVGWFRAKQDLRR